MPDSMTSPQISVNTPNGSQTIGNPLYSYKFHPIQAADLGGSPVIFFPCALRSLF
jgi:tyrosinase